MLVKYFFFSFSRLHFKRKVMWPWACWILSWVCLEFNISGGLLGQRPDNGKDKSKFPGVGGR